MKIKLKLFAPIGVWLLSKMLAAQLNVHSKNKEE